VFKEVSIDIYISKKIANLIMHLRSSSLNTFCQVFEFALLLCNDIRNYYHPRMIFKVLKHPENYLAIK
jgi:hypothetical protein